MEDNEDPSDQFLSDVNAWEGPEIAALTRDQLSIQPSFFMALYVAQGRYYAADLMRSRSELGRRFDSTRA